MLEIDKESKTTHRRTKFTHFVRASLSMPDCPVHNVIFIYGTKHCSTLR